jgi:hypothetical protein
MDAGALLGLSPDPAPGLALRRIATAGRSRRPAFLSMEPDSVEHHGEISATGSEIE